MEVFVFICIIGIVIWLTGKKPSSTQNNTLGHKDNDNDNDKNLIVTPKSIVDNPKPTIISSKQSTTPKSTIDVSKPALNNAEPKPHGTQSNQYQKGGLWISNGNSLTIQGYSISGGMVYVGKDFKGPDGYRTECALINPDLRVDNLNNDYSIRRLNYWPTYSEASPDARASYLNWLSKGKKDPTTDIGYVFLYFYGLERRLLYDNLHGMVPHSEVNDLVTEVKRLISVYGDNDSFNMYANSLLAYIQADQYSNSYKPNQIALPSLKHCGLPIDIKIYLGHMVKNDIPIPGDLALAWYFSTPDPPVYTRTPAHRCQQEFKALFCEEYTRNFGQGLKLKENKTKLKIAHRPASSSLHNQSYAKVLDLPDIERQTSAINKIAPLIQICQEKLDSYSRYLGRNPDSKDTFDALLELPASAWPDTVKRYLNTLQAEIDQKNMLTIKFSSMLEHFPEWRDKSKKRFSLFMDKLQSCKIGMEPDIRITGIKPETDDTVILFPLEDSSIANTRPSYSLAALTVQLAVMVSEADGEVSKSEIDLIYTQIERTANLTSPERNRLKVYLQWLITQTLSTKGIKKRIQSLAIGDRELIGDLLIQVSQVDGTISASEIKLMEKIYGMLDIDLNILYSKIHTSYTEPVTVKSAVESKTGFSIPAPPTGSTPTEKHFSLDMNKIASLHNETEHVGTLLNSIFSQEEIEQPKEQDDKSADSNEMWGLSPSIFEIVQFLSHKSAWHRRELEEMAYNKNLMLEGVLEQINEAAFDRFDDPFIEGEDPFEINQEIAMVVNQ